MGVHLITGYKGEEHIQSKDVRSFNAAMFGGGEFVMEIGNQIEGSIINNNTIRILDGDILMQGGHIRIETDTYEDLTITTGTAGKNRIDLIVMTYEKNNSDGTENAYLEVIKGTESAGTASDPEYIRGVISEGALKNQMPLYRVKLEGVVLSEIESLFTTIPTYKKLAEQAAAQYKATINALKSAEILDTMEEIEANTQGNLFAGALALKEGFDKLNSNLGLKVDEIFNDNNNTSNALNSDGSGIGNKFTIPNASKYKAYAIVFYYGGNTGLTGFVIAPNEVNKIQRCSVTGFWSENNITKGQISMGTLNYENGNVTIEAVNGSRFTYNTLSSYSSVIIRAYGLY